MVAQMVERALRICWTERSMAQIPALDPLRPASKRNLYWWGCPQLKYGYKPKVVPALKQIAGLCQARVAQHCEQSNSGERHIIKKMADQFCFQPQVFILQVLTNKIKTYLNIYWHSPIFFICFAKWSPFRLIFPLWYLLSFLATLSLLWSQHFIIPTNSVQFSFRYFYC